MAVNLLTAMAAAAAEFRGHVACNAIVGARTPGVTIPPRGRRVTLPPGGNVIVVSEDRRLLELVAAELREAGCRVFCAFNLAEAMEMVRAGLPRRFVLVRVGAEVWSPEDLRRAMAAGLADHALPGDGVPETVPETVDDGWPEHERTARRQLPN